MVKRAAIIENGIVKNVVKADSSTILANGWIEIQAGVTVSMGYEYNSGVFAEPVEPVVMPDQITAEQAKRAMSRTTHNAVNLYDTVKSLINNLEEKDETKIAYKNAAIWHRNNDMIAAISATVGLSDQQVDDLFVLGNSIK